MADWSKPTLTSTYTDYLSETTGRDVDCATQFSVGTPTNIPTGTIQWSSSLGRWRLWSGTAWGELASTYNLTGLTCTSFSNTGNTTLGDSSADTVTSNAANWTFANATTIAGTITYSGAVSFNGNTTLGDASTDAVTLNAGTISIPNNVNFSGGNVGVGKTPGYKLDVNGTVNAVNYVLNGEVTGGSGTFGYTNANGPGIQMWGSTTGNAGAMLFTTGGSERARIDSAGNVGIGTSSPSTKLDVAGNFTLSGIGQNTTDSRIIRAPASTDPVDANRASITLGTVAGASSSDSYIDFATNKYGISSGTRMRIDSAGFVGVATSSPQAALHVNGDVIMQNGVYFEMAAPATKSAAATLTGAEVVAGYVQYTGTAATLTLPTATDLQAAMPSGVATLNDIAFDLTIINTGSGTATLAVNTGITAVGALTTAASTATTFHIRKTATNTFIIYRT